MAASIESLTTPLVKEDVLKDLYVLGGYFGLPVPAMQPGEPIPTVLAKFVEWFVDGLWNPIAIPALRAPFLDWATGDWLTLIAALIYNRPRIDAQAGTGSIDIENRSTVSGTVSIGVGTVRVRNTLTGATYTNTTASSVIQWDGMVVPFPRASPVMIFEADVVGTASNALPSQIAAYPVPPTTSPSVGLYALTNVFSILGSDEETDVRLVARCRASVQSVSVNGPRGAYYDSATNPIAAFTSRNLPAPASWGTRIPAITRVRIQEPGGGIVLVWLASDSDGAGGDSAHPDSDVGMANVAIQMFDVPPGVTATVAAAIPQDLNLGSVVLDVAAESRITTIEAIATATASLNAFNSTLPIGGARDVASPSQGFVFRAAALVVLGAGTGIKNVNLPALPGADINGNVAIGGNAVARISATITANIVTQGA